jgi:DNA helicase-2/ATP-dependent DNA helicase PcrA
LIQYAALVKDINFLGLDKGKVPIVTAHQVKGLEFDYVFIIGANEYVFPNSRSDIEEEKRLFYVAMTRAKKKIFITYSRFNDYDRPAAKSRFIDYIDEKHVDFIS